MTEIINDQDRPLAVVDIKMTVETAVRHIINEDPYSEYEEVDSNEDEEDREMELINGIRDEVQALRAELADFRKEFRTIPNP